MKKIVRFAESTYDKFIIAILCFSVISFGICFLGHLIAGERFSVAEILWIFPVFLFQALIVKLGLYLKNKSSWLTFLIGTSMYVVIFLCFIFFVDTHPAKFINDLGEVWRSGVEMAEGRFTAGITPQEYMHCYNWQVGMSAFISVFIRLFGESYVVLQLVSFVCMVTISFELYVITSRIAGRDAARVTYILSSLFLPWILSSSILSNHQPSMVLLLLAVILFDRHTLWASLAIGVVLAVLNVLRPYAIILIIAIAVYYTYTILKDGKWVKPVINTLSILAAYFVVISLFNFIFIELKYTDIPISSPRLTYYKYYAGLTGDLNTEWPFKHDYDEYNSNQKSQISQLVEKPSTYVFIGGKMVRFLGNLDHQYFFVFNDKAEVVGSYPVKSLQFFNWLQYIFLLLLSGVGYIKWRKKRSVHVLGIFTIGYIFIHVIIEAISLYRFEFYPFLLVLAGIGVSALPNKLKLLKKK